MKYEAGLLHPDWPEIKWNITGLINYRMFVVLLSHIMKQQNISYALDSFHGCPDLLWNGGRLNKKLPDYSDIFDVFQRGPGSKTSVRH